jgi:hypothetical protein
MEDNDNNIWGTKANYYSRNKRDEEDTDNEAEEALNMQQKKLQKLREANLLDSDNEEKEADNNVNQNKTILKRRKKFNINSDDEAADQKRFRSEEEGKEENTQILKNLRKSFEEVKENLAPILEILSMGRKMENLEAYLIAKKDMHILYSIYLVYFLNFKLKGKIPDHHPVVKRILYIKSLLNNMNDLDAQLTHRIDNIVNLIEQQRESCEESVQEVELNEVKLLGKKTKPNVTNILDINLGDYINHCQSKITDLKEKKVKLVEKESKTLKAKVNDKNAKGVRLANENILKAKGIYRKRKNYQGNAKLMNREKFAKKQKIRKNYVKEYEGKPEVYGGEATGIRRDLIRSTKIS